MIVCVPVATKSTFAQTISESSIQEGLAYVKNRIPKPPMSNKSGQCFFYDWETGAHETDKQLQNGDLPVRVPVAGLCGHKGAFYIFEGYAYLTMSSAGFDRYSTKSTNLDVVFRVYKSAEQIRNEESQINWDPFRTINGKRVVDTNATRRAQKQQNCVSKGSGPDCNDQPDWRLPGGSSRGGKKNNTDSYTKESSLQANSRQVHDTRIKKTLPSSENKPSQSELDAFKTVDARYRKSIIGTFKLDDGNSYEFRQNQRVIINKKDTGNWRIEVGTLKITNGPKVFNQSYKVGVIGKEIIQLYRIGDKKFFKGTRLKSTTQQTNENVLMLADDMPELIGGLGSVQHQIKYPEAAKRANIQGRVFVQFVVNEEGEVLNPVVIRGIGGGCDEEAVRVMRLAKFKPATHKGRVVKVKMSLPLTFKLR